MEQKWSRSRKPTAPKRKNNFDQHGDKEELYFRAQAFKKAAKTLVKAIEDGKMSRIPADILPVVLLYRHATELHLKVILLGYGANFLPVKPLPARIYGTHSLRKLAAQVCRILQAIGWYRGFKPECVADACDLLAVISKLDGFDTSRRAFWRTDDQKAGIGSVGGFPEFARRVDAVLDILDAAADGLAAVADTGGLVVCLSAKVMKRRSNESVISFTEPRIAPVISVKP